MQKVFFRFVDCAGIKNPKFRSANYFTELFSKISWGHMQPIRLPARLHKKKIKFMGAGPRRGALISKQQRQLFARASTPNCQFYFFVWDAQTTRSGRGDSTDNFGMFWRG